MAKLTIEYRTQDNENNFFKGKTYYSFYSDFKTTKISIAPEETRKLADIVSGIEKELTNGYNLKVREKFEISEDDKKIMEYEEENERLNNIVAYYVKKSYEKMLNGEITLDELINFLESELLERKEKNNARINSV